MAYRGTTYFDDDHDPPRERGTRRRRLAGYLKAANELRQSYTQSWSRPDGDNNNDGPFADVAAVSNGDEEMIVFPSYAKRHARIKPTAVPGTIQTVSGTGRDIRDTTGTGDAEFWREQWERYENDNAIVDVDIRGWLFVPQRGNLTRRQRLLVALARQLVGIPAPGGTGRSSASSSLSSSPVRGGFPSEEELAASREAEAIVRRGEAEAKIANVGGFSELDGHAPISRTSSTDTMSAQYMASDTASVRRVDLDTANQNLMTRLRPFMANPLANVTINAFFYNDHISRQRTFHTDASGHFSLRAALDFVPTHVRVLSTEKLSLETDVKIVEPSGISLVSDIDDTVKHAAITKGAREIFRNAFTRDLEDLTVPGIREWYKALADRGVQFHYVSNSPWQLYPVLTSYFSLAGLPLGTFHLKQYSGMLQGIFEPVAERKKAAMDRILRDFPERRFLLIGDSGEADLEVYTDVVLEHPDRIIGVFIRDVTTAANKFFSSSIRPQPADRNVTSAPRPTSDELQSSRRLPNPDVSDGPADQDTTRASFRPPLPARSSTAQTEAQEQEDLIDLSDPVDESRLHIQGRQVSESNRPRTPTKPARLRGSPRVSDGTDVAVKEKEMTHAGIITTAAPDANADGASREHRQHPPPPLPIRRPPIGSSQLSKPDIAFHSPETPPKSLRTESATRAGADCQMPESPTKADAGRRRPQMPPLRHKRSSYSIVSERLSGNWSGSEQDEPPIHKKEELWNRRLERAKQILSQNGVLLRTWRVGEDMMDESIAAIEREFAKMKSTARQPPVPGRKPVPAPTPPPSRSSAATRP